MQVIGLTGLGVKVLGVQGFVLRDFGVNSRSFWSSPLKSLIRK